MRTTLSNNLWGIVPAAGIGSRCEGEVPKQYIPLSGVPVLALTLDKLCQFKPLKKISIALHPDDQHFAQLQFNIPHKIVTCVGGLTRMQSVYNALLALTEASDEDWVMVHDAVRPCITQADLQKLYQAVKQYPYGGCLAMPVFDTLKLANHNGTVESTCDRSQYWQALTPQMFPVGLLKKALVHAMQKSLPVSDEAGAVEALGHAPLLVAGRRDNLKLTVASDIAIIQAILAREQQACFV